MILLAKCEWCEANDCNYLALGYPYCPGCGDHHRSPVAVFGDRCPVDLYEERSDRNVAAGRESWDDG